MVNFGKESENKDKDMDEEKDDIPEIDDSPLEDAVEFNYVNESAQVTDEKKIENESASVLNEESDKIDEDIEELLSNENPDDLFELAEPKEDKISLDSATDNEKTKVRTTINQIDQKLI